MTWSSNLNVSFYFLRDPDAASAQVKRMIVARDQEQKSILRVAVESGRTDVCDALLFFMYDVLGEAAVRS